VAVSLESKVAEPELSTQMMSSANKPSNRLLKDAFSFYFNRQILRGTQCSHLTSMDHPRFSPNYVQNSLNLITFGNNCCLSRECGMPGRFREYPAQLRGRTRSSYPDRSERRSTQTYHFSTRCSWVGKCWS
jgi:hypothetical protein